MYRGESSDADIIHEPKWTPEANETLMELLEEKSEDLFGVKSLTITPKVRMEIWKEIARRMRESGFNQTMASCNKKYSNMRRTYMANKKNNRKIRFRNKKAGPGGKIRRLIVWPYFERVGKLLKMSGAMPETDDDEEEEPDDDAEYVEEVETEEVPSPGTEVNRAVRKLLKTSRDPVLILEPMARPKRDPDTVVSEELEPLADDDKGHDVDPDADTQSPEDPDWQPDSFMPQRISERNAQRKAKLKASKRSSASGPTTSFGKRSKVETGTFLPPLTISSPDALVVEEVQGLRHEVRGINRNLEKLVDAQNRLNDNFERFFTSLRMRKN